MAAKEQRQIRNRIASQINLRDAQVEALISRIEKIIRTDITRIVRDLESELSSNEQIRAVSAAQILGTIETELANAGLNDELLRVREAYGTELANVQDLLRHSTGIGITFANTDLTIIETLADFDIARFSSTIQQYVDDSRTVLIRQVVTGQTPDLEGLEDVLEGRMHHVRTELNTSLQSMHRTVSAKKADELGLSRFWYTGAPVDNAMRPFCLSILEGSGSSQFNVPARPVPVFTKQEIEAMSNGQGFDVRTSGGGWNCRHHWVPVTDAVIEAVGF